MRGLRTAAVPLGGSFVKENGGRRDWLFYLGKYEVTQAQYQALAAGAGGKGRTPQAGLTRIEVQKVHRVLQSLAAQRGSERVAGA